MSAPTISTMQLLCFVRVVDTGSFVEAGRQLGLSTSGVSKTVSRLEEGRGVRLLNRSTHSLSLTPEGERLVDLARDAVRGIEIIDAALTASARDGTQGRVRLGTPTAFVRSCLAPLLPAFRALHPDILLDLRGSDQLVDLAEEAVDLVLRTGSTDGIPGHLQRSLFSFSWITCASTRYLEERGTPAVPADLADHDLIAFRNLRTGLVDPWRFKATSDGEVDARWLPDPAVIFDDANAIAAAVISGAGIGWAPRWLLADVLARGEVRTVLDAFQVRSTVSMIRRNQAQTPPRVAAVMEFLVAHSESFGD